MTVLGEELTAIRKKNVGADLKTTPPTEGEKPFEKKSFYHIIIYNVNE